MNERIKQILNNMFQILLILFLITLLLQQFYPFEVNSTININWFMIIVIIMGSLSILFPPKDTPKKKNSFKKKDYYFIYLLGIIGTILIYIKIKELGWLAYLMSIIGGILIILLSYLALNEE